jgi:hypothetical protein
MHYRRLLSPHNDISYEAAGGTALWAATVPSVKFAADC